LNNLNHEKEIQENKELTTKDTVVFFLSFIGLVLCGVFYFVYPFPSGEATLSGFFAFFLRELLILGLVIICLICVLLDKVVKYLSSKKKQ